MRYVFGLLALAILAIIAFYALDPSYQQMRADKATYEARALQLDLERREMELYQARAQAAATAPMGVLVSYGAMLLVFAGVIAIAWLGIDVYRQRRQPLTYISDIPLDRRLLTSGAVDRALLTLIAESVQGRLATAQIAAEHQPGQVPASYAPHITYHHELKSDTQPPMLTDGGPASASAIPTFAQLLEQQRVGKGNPLLLGYDVQSGSEIAGSWLDLYSTAIAGMSGTGKTTSQRFLAAQTALFGAKFAIVDPHGGAEGDSLASTLAPLQSAFLCEPASSDKAILEVVKLVAGIGRRRVEGKDHDKTPIVLWVDELTALLGRSSIADALGELLERIAQEYRKRGVYVSASGQIWTAARTTSELRDSFASVLCHRMKRSQARLLLPTDEAEQVERLEVGRAVLWRTSGQTQTLQIPNTTAEDCRRVAGLLTDSQTTIRLPSRPMSSQSEAADRPTDKPMSSQGVTGPELAYNAPVSAEAARALQLFKDGLNPAAIVAELRGVKSNEGKRYQVALDEVMALMREGLKV